MQVDRVEKVIPQTDKIERDVLPDAEQADWQRLALEGLSAAYGETEPDYPATLSKEANRPHGAE
jgi:hypothetical protein